MDSSKQEAIYISNDRTVRMYDPATVTSWGSLKMSVVTVGMFSLPNLELTQSFSHMSFAKKMDSLVFQSSGTQWRACELVGQCAGGEGTVCSMASPLAADTCPGYLDSLKAMSGMLLGTISQRTFHVPLEGIVLHDTTVHINDWA